MSVLMEKIDMLVAGFGGVVGWFFGAFDGLYYALLAFTIADYGTGLLAAAVQHQLSSSVGFKGIAKKVYIFTLVGVMNVIDTQILKQGAALRTAVLLFFCANEGLSVLENADTIGVPFPDFIRKALKQIKEKAAGEEKTV